jgi:hypothetical protein
LFGAPGAVVGVGQDEYAPSEMGRTNGLCGDTIPFRIVPEGGKVTEYASHSCGKKPWDVLHDNVSGLYSSDEA